MAPVRNQQVLTCPSVSSMGGAEHPFGSEPNCWLLMAVAIDQAPVPQLLTATRRPVPQRADTPANAPRQHRGNARHRSV